MPGALRDEEGNYLPPGQQMKEFESMVGWESFLRHPQIEIRIVPGTRKDTFKVAEVDIENPRLDITHGLWDLESGEKFGGDDT